MYISCMYIICNTDFVTISSFQMSACVCHQNYCMSIGLTFLHHHCLFPLYFFLSSTDNLLTFPHRCVLAEGLLHLLHPLSLSLYVLIFSQSLHPSYVGQGSKALTLCVVPKAFNHFAFCKIKINPSVAPFLSSFCLFLLISINVVNLFLSSFNKIKSSTIQMFFFLPHTK